MKFSQEQVNEISSMGSEADKVVRILQVAVDREDKDLDPANLNLYRAWDSYQVTEQEKKYSMMISEGGGGEHVENFS